MKPNSSLMAAIAVSTLAASGLIISCSSSQPSSETDQPSQDTAAAAPIAGTDTAPEVKASPSASPETPQIAANTSEPAPAPQPTEPVKPAHRVFKKSRAAKAKPPVTPQEAAPAAEAVAAEPPTEKPQADPFKTQPPAQHRDTAAVASPASLGSAPAPTEKPLPAPPVAEKPAPAQHSGETREPSAARHEDQSSEQEPGSNRIMLGAAILAIAGAAGGIILSRRKAKLQS